MNAPDAAAAGIAAALLLAGSPLAQPTAPAGAPPANAPAAQAQTTAPAQPAQAVTPPEQRPDPAASCDRVARETHASFADADEFDRRLGSLLAQRPERLVVEVPRPFAPETTPDRLHTWLVAVHRGGGAVRRQDIPCGQAAGTQRRIRFGIRSWLSRPSREVQAAARGYDVTLWTEQASAAVAQVQFTRRSAR